MSRQLVRRTAALAALFSIAATAALGAQAPAAPGAPVLSPTAAAQAASLASLPPSALDGRPSIELTLEQAVALALEKNFDIQNQKYSLLNSLESLYRAKVTYYEPSINPSLSWNSGESVSPTNRNETQSSGLTISTTKSIPTGGSATLTVQPYSHPSARNYSNQVSLSVRHELLRGLGITLNRQNLRNAEISYANAELSYRGRILDTVQSVETSFFNLLSQRENLLISRYQLQIEERGYNETLLRRSTGLLTVLDESTREAALINQRNSLIQAEQAVQQAEDSLRVLLGGGNFDIAIIPIAPPEFSGTPPTVADAYKLVLENNLDYQSRKYAAEQNEQSVKSAKNNLLPQLTLNTGVGYNGRDTTFTTALTRLRERDNYNWSAGLSLSFNWGMHAEKSNYRVALNNRNTFRIGMQQLEQNLLIQVRNAVRTVENAVRTLASRQRATELAELNFRREEEIFNVGNSTALVIIQRTQALESARISELQARISLRNAYTSLQRLQGLTLVRYGIVIPEAIEERVPEGAPLPPIKK